MLVPADQRERVVASVEARIVREYADRPEHAHLEPDAPGTPALIAISPPIQRDGFVEHTETDYDTATTPAKRRPAQKPRTRRA